MDCFKEEDRWPAQTTKHTIEPILSTQYQNNDETQTFSNLQAKDDVQSCNQVDHLIALSCFKTPTSS